MALILETRFDTVAETKKPEFGDSGLYTAICANDNSHIVAETEISYKTESAMSENSNYNDIYKNFKMISNDAEFLMDNDIDAFNIMTQIMFRARRSDLSFNPHNLEIAQALLGDFVNLKQTEQRYRDAKERIEQKYRLATFKGTNKGTIATLLDTRFCDLNLKSKNEQKNGQGTNKRTEQERTENGQGTTNQYRIETNNNKKDSFQSSFAPTPKKGPRKIADSISFSFDDKKFNGISENDLSNWETAYPGVNFTQELAKAVEWILSNPTKTKKIWRKFLTNWFSRCAEKKFIASAGISQKKEVNPEIEWEKTNRNNFFTWKKSAYKELKHMEYKNGYVINNHNGKELSCKMMPEVFSSHFQSVAGVKFG